MSKNAESAKNLPSGSKEGAQTMEMTEAAKLSSNKNQLSTRSGMPIHLNRFIQSNKDFFDPPAQEDVPQTMMQKLGRKIPQSTRTTSPFTRRVQQAKVGVR